MLFKRKIPVDWNLDYEFIKWLNKWFKEYKRKAGKHVDLEFREYNYLGEKITQLQVINKVIELTDKLLIDDYFFNDDGVEIVDEVFELFHLVFWDMWW